MEIKRNLVDSSKYSIKCPYTMNPQFVVVHNTANDASAENEISYMRSNNSSTSFHYAVDDTCAVQGIEENRNAWHAGDGGNGDGNRNGIAIEICYSKSGEDRFIQAEKNAVELIVSILKKYGWGIEQVKKHQDFANKYCPHRTLDMGWERFLNMIKEKMGQATVEVTQTTNVVKNTATGTIADIQSTLNSRYGLSIAVDNIYGKETKKALVKGLQTELNTQYGKGLVVDGIFGTNTYNACVNVKKGAKGNITYILQALLVCNGYSTNGVDGIFGSGTENAVRQYQQRNGLSVDGIAGKNTFEKLCT